MTNTDLQEVGTGKGGQVHLAHRDDDVTLCGRSNIAWRTERSALGASCFRCLKSRHA